MFERFKIQNICLFFWDLHNKFENLCFYFIKLIISYYYLLIIILDYDFIILSPLCYRNSNPRIFIIISIFFFSSNIQSLGFDFPFSNVIHYCRNSNHRIVIFLVVLEAFHSPLIFQCHSIKLIFLFIISLRLY